MKHFEFFQKYPSTRKSISNVKHALQKLQEAVTLPETQLHYISLCVIEAFTNAIVHGNQIEPTQFVELHIVIEETEAKICITDQGFGFDKQAISNPLDIENLLKDSGRGVFIMNNFCQKLDYTYNQRGFSVLMQFDLNENTN